MDHSCKINDGSFCDQLEVKAERISDGVVQHTTIYQRKKALSAGLQIGTTVGCFRIEGLVARNTFESLI